MYSQVPATWKMEVSRLKAHGPGKMRDSSLRGPISQKDGALGSQSLSPPLRGDRGSSKEEEGNRTQRSGRRLRSSLHADEHSPFRHVKRRSSVCHPGSAIQPTSPWCYIALAPWLKVSMCPGAGMPEGWSLCLSKLVPRILIPTCCLSTDYVLVRHTRRNDVRRMVGRVRIPHCYNFPPLLTFRKCSAPCTFCVTVYIFCLSHQY